MFYKLHNGQRLDCEMFALIIIGMEGNSLWFCSARLGDVPKWVAMQIALADAQHGAISTVASKRNTLLLTFDLTTKQLSKIVLLGLDHKDCLNLSHRFITN